jgi:hypothetical protein
MPATDDARKLAGAGASCTEQIVGIDVMAVEQPMASRPGRAYRRRDQTADITMVPDETDQPSREGHRSRQPHFGEGDTHGAGRSVGGSLGGRALNRLNDHLGWRGEDQRTRIRSLKCSMWRQLKQR